jgi:hypothetical protein
MSLYGIGRGRLGGREEGSGAEENILGSRNSRRRSKGPDAVLSGQMPAGEVGGGKGVEEVEVDAILENLKSKFRSAHISRF